MNHASRTLPEAPNEKLTGLVERLKSSSFFSSPTDDQWQEKRPIFLVLAGMKPLGTASSGRWQADEGGRHTIADDPVAVIEFLHSLGLQASVELCDDYATDVVFAMKAHSLRQYRSAGTPPAVIGRLFGFPQTATEAFERGDLLGQAEQDALCMQVGVRPDLVGFRCSRDNWRSELAVAMLREDRLAQVGLL